jgi:hypothetical protein
MQTCQSLPKILSLCRIITNQLPMVKPPVTIPTLHDSGTCQWRLAKRAYGILALCLLRAVKSCSLQRPLVKFNGMVPMMTRVWWRISVWSSFTRNIWYKRRHSHPQASCSSEPAQDFSWAGWAFIDVCIKLTILELPCAIITKEFSSVVECYEIEYAVRQDKNMATFSLHPFTWLTTPLRSLLLVPK